MEVKTLIKMKKFIYLLCLIAMKLYQTTIEQKKNEIYAVDDDENFLL